MPEAEWRELEVGLELPDLNEKYAALYDRLYSAAEIREILEFHRTPAGQKWHASAQQLQDHVHLAQRDFESRLGERVALLLHAHGYSLAGAPGLPGLRPAPTLANPGVDRPRIVQPLE